MIPKRGIVAENNTIGIHLSKPAGEMRFIDGEVFNPDLMSSWLKFLRVICRWDSALLCPVIRLTLICKRNKINAFY